MPEYYYMDKDTLLRKGFTEGLEQFPRYINMQMAIGDTYVMPRLHFGSVVNIDIVGVAAGATGQLFAAVANQYTVVRRVVFNSFAAGLVTLEDTAGNVKATMVAQANSNVEIDFGEFGSGIEFFNTEVLLRNNTGALTNFRGFIQLALLRLS